METRRAKATRKAQRAQLTTLEARAREEPSLKESIIIPLVVVVTILVLLAAAVTVVKLIPTVNFGLIIILFIVLAVIAFGALRILSGKDVVQVFTQIPHAITGIVGVIDKASSSDSGTATTSSGTEETSVESSPATPFQQHRSAHPQPSAKPDSPSQSNPHPQRSPHVGGNDESPASADAPAINDAHQLAKAHEPGPTEREKDVSPPVEPSDDTQQDAISIVKTCYFELVKWKISVHNSAYELFTGGNNLSDDQYRYQYQILEKIVSLASNLSIYVEHLPQVYRRRRSRLIGVIYDIQSLAHQLQIYVTQANRTALRGEIQHQFTLLSGHFERIAEAFNELGI